MLAAFVAFREEVVGAAHQVPARQGARPRPCPGRPRHRRGQYRRGDPHHPHLRRTRTTAREELMARDWPAQRRGAADRADRRPAPPDRRGRHLPPLRRAGARHPRAAPARLTALGREEIAEELEKLAAEITDYLDILRSRAARARPSSRTSCEAIRDEFATPRRTEIVEADGDLEDEDLIQREDMVVTVTHAGWIKRVPLDDLPGAAARRQGPLRHGDEGGGFRHPPVRRQHPHADAVLLLARHGLQAEGLAAAAGGAAGARQGAGQPAAARRKASASPRSCRCPRTRRAGRARRDVRHHRRHGAAQQAVRFRPASTATARSP